MASRIEDYGFIGDLQGAALVSKDGSVDWLCLPKFDSDPCMASLLGRDEHGHWRIHPAADVRRIERRYVPGTLILQTDYGCDSGVVRITDFMPIVPGRHAVVRIVEGLRGEVPVTFTLRARFGFGKHTPWITREAGGCRILVAPDALSLRSPVPLRADGADLHAEFRVSRGKSFAFELSWHAAHHAAPAPLDPRGALERTADFWTEWSGRSTYRGPYKEAVDSSLIFLKGMTYAPTGAIVAAPTTSLPEQLGGAKNYDYRYCWLRDAALTMRAFLAGGYTEEAAQLRDWTLRAAAGHAADVQIMYGLNGERRLTEFTVDWLPGYEESRPVRVGNAAHSQFQLDVYGELVACFYEARAHGMEEERTGAGWQGLLEVMDFVEQAWQRPDDGIWEIRGGRKHYVHSKVMAWLAVDRFIKYIEAGSQGDGHAERAALLPRFRGLRSRIHRDVCARGFNPRVGGFTQAYDATPMDSGVLAVPVVGFLPADDPRVKGTIHAVEKELMKNGLLFRFIRTPEKYEGAFIACSFWLVRAYVAVGRRREAERLFERLLSLRNDLGLLAEEYDVDRGRQIGNFPQAFSHLALITAAQALAGVEEPLLRR